MKSNGLPDTLTWYSVLFKRSKQSMNNCKICGKAYKTQSSLTRHSRNHSPKASQHQCTQCNVAFTRRDVLARHVNLSHPTPLQRTRRRCHTACGGCRNARIKCDGGLPCQPCRDTGRSCCFGENNRRTSKAVSVSTIDSSTETANTLDRPIAEEPNALAPPQAAADSASLLFDHTSPGNSFTTVPGQHDQHAIDGVSWPWLHENLFLQTGPFLDASSPFNGFQQENSQTETLRIPSDDYTELLSIVDDLVGLAARAALSDGRHCFKATDWQSASLRLATFIEHLQPPLSQEPSMPGRILHDLAQIYMKSFNPLWPMFSEDDFVLQELHPVLQLTLSSMGAMYGSTLQRRYGSMMHERLRRLLAAALFDLEGPIGDLFWLAQSRELAQVTALYFGQRQGFSYAQVNHFAIAVSISWTKLTSHIAFGSYCRRSIAADESLRPISA